MKRLFLLALLGLALLALVATPSHANASDDDLDESGSRARSEQTLVETTPWAADDFLNGQTDGRGPCENVEEGRREESASLSSQSRRVRIFRKCALRDQPDPAISHC
jgi:hypothetical protein